MPKPGPQDQPKSVGQYYIMEKIAQGGMAEIYRGLAYDVHGIHQKAVCIKKILPHLSADRDFIGSIIDEAKLAVRLVHGNIAQTFDLGKVGDDYYMVMEYVEGATLSQINRRCLTEDTLIPIPFLVYFISEVAQGLDYMHRRTDEDGNPLHIVHRDISPQNIMISYSGTVKIIDFGIAKAAFKAGQTDSGMLKGKFAYMSPEQSYGDAIDHRSDIFSLGIILHEMLTGNRLFKSADSRETIRNVRRAQITPPSQINELIHEDLDRITLNALAKDRRHRYAYASELRDDLVKFLHKHFPDFKPSDAAGFVQELFKDEISRPRQVDADSKTPALIINKTNSALADDSQFEATGAARAPLDMREFMLDEEPAPQPETKEEGAEPDTSEEASTTESKQPLEIDVPEEPSRFAMIVRNKLVWVLLVIVAASIVRFGFQRLSRRPPADEAPAVARVMIVTTPSDALISLDGRPVGQASPLTIDSISPDDEHTLTVSREGFLTSLRTFALKRGEFQSLSVNLKPAGPSTTSVELLSTPPGATIFLDDQETLHRTPFTLEKLRSEKPLTIGLYLKGFRFWSKRVVPKAGQTKSFDVSLEKDYASLLIESDPPKSLVVIDGTPVGQTPLTREQLEPDRVHRIEIWQEGYKPVTKEVKPSPGQREVLRVELEPAPSIPIQQSWAPSSETTQSPEAEGAIKGP